MMKSYKKEDQTGNVGYGNPYMENGFNNHQELDDLGGQEKGQSLLNVLAEALRVSHVVPQERLEANLEGPREEMMCHEAQKKDDTHPEVLLQRYFHLIEASVDKHFPKLPVGNTVNQLEGFLIEMQRTVLVELLRLAPLLKEVQLLKHLIACYHQRMFDCLHQILQHVNTKKEAFTVLDWVLHTYLSQELLGHPDLWDEALHAVDLLLLTEWIPQAEKKLLATVQEDISTSLRRILQNEESGREVCVSGDEAFIQLHLDVIQCINAVLQKAKMMSQTLTLKVQIVCWQELQDFVERYVNVEKKHLQKQARMGTSGTMHFFKTFNTCNELKLYISRIARDDTSFDCVKPISTLKGLEALSWKLLLERPIKLAQISLKKYFKREDEQMENLIKEIEKHFHYLPKDQDTQKTVINEAYQRITLLYLQHLVQSNHGKLVKRWDYVGKRVMHDAELLHSIFSCLNPDVKQWNIILIKVREVLECSDIESLKIIVSEILRDCSSTSAAEHLPALLRWKGGLSWRQTREVLEASQEVYPIYLSQTRSAPWFGCLLCC
ncbi:exocyst complex component 3-like protein isoform X1 [Coregonus clupeaformis]|uniref:exocyst complex component 3-like protein isoform X1 n=1 Tax=Coregonus clupeaformis TaxID=59861 RepID=UPI001BE0A974|nr:exocyst complex component 3-like protein isoform X1 [Coregonus clupeaformis]